MPAEDEGRLAPAELLHSAVNVLIQPSLEQEVRLQHRSTLSYTAKAGLLAKVRSSKSRRQVVGLLGLRAQILTHSVLSDWGLSVLPYTLGSETWRPICQCRPAIIALSICPLNNKFNAKGSRRACKICLLEFLGLSSTACLASKPGAHLPAESRAPCITPCPMPSARRLAPWACCSHGRRWSACTVCGPRQRRATPPAAREATRRCPERWGWWRTPQQSALWLSAAARTKNVIRLRKALSYTGKQLEGGNL